MLGQTREHFWKVLQSYWRLCHRCLAFNSWGAKCRSSLSVVRRSSIQVLPTGVCWGVGAPRVFCERSSWWDRSSLCPVSWRGLWAAIISHLPTLLMWARDPSHLLPQVPSCAQVLPLPGPRALPSCPPPLPTRGSRPLWLSSSLSVPHESSAQRGSLAWSPCSGCPPSSFHRQPETSPTNLVSSLSLEDLGPSPPLLSSGPGTGHLPRLSWLTLTAAP